jgi:cysteine sulfinate desulfinase/cysteine desulfurase-like protein
MGCPPEVVSSSVRFSLSFENTPDEIDDAVERIGNVVGRLRSAASRETVFPNGRVNRQPEPSGRTSA